MPADGVGGSIRSEAEPDHDAVSVAAAGRLTALADKWLGPLPSVPRAGSRRLSPTSLAPMFTSPRNFATLENGVSPSALAPVCSQPLPELSRSIPPMVTAYCSVADSTCTSVTMPAKGEGRLCHLPWGRKTEGSSPEAGREQLKTAAAHP